MQHLINKYFEGKTTLEEERQLKAYFNSPNVSAADLPFKSYFQFLKEEANLGLSDNFDENIISQIATSEKRGKIMLLRQRIMRVAAIFLLMIGAHYSYQEITRPTEIDWAKYEIKDPEKAFAATKAALVFTSKKLKQSSKQTANKTKNLKKIKLENFLNHPFFNQRKNRKKD